MTVHTWFVDLSLEACHDLLATTSLGRLGVILDSHPEIFPVNHVFDVESGSVMFPTKPGTKLQAALKWPSVAFEVDGVEPDEGGAWSVLVVGRAQEVSDPDEIARAAGARHVLWRSGDDTTWVRIVPTKVTGRRISAVES